MQWHWIISRFKFLESSWQNDKSKSPLNSSRRWDERHMPALPMEARILLPAVKTPPPLCEAKTLGLCKSSLQNTKREGQIPLLWANFILKDVSFTVAFLSTFYLKGQVLHPIFWYFRKKPFPCPLPSFLDSIYNQMAYKIKTFDLLEGLERKFQTFLPSRDGRGASLTREMGKGLKGVEVILPGLSFPGSFYQYGNSFLDCTSS